MNLWGFLLLVLGVLLVLVIWWANKTAKEFGKKK